MFLFVSFLSRPFLIHKYRGVLFWEPLNVGVGYSLSQVSSHYCGILSSYKTAVVKTEESNIHGLEVTLGKLYDLPES